MKTKELGFSTRLIHAGENPDQHGGAVITPIYQTSTFLYNGEDNENDLRYTRLSNSPTHESLHAKLARVENGEDAVATSSGMSAISTTLLSFLKSGDHMMAQTKVYGGTFFFLTTDLPRLGISHTFFDAGNPETWEQALTPQTKLLYVESMSNPILEIYDLEDIVAFAKKHDLLTVIDNTFASPVNFNPLDLGFDVVVHSCTKYMNGHSDVIAGGIISSKKNIDIVKKKLGSMGGVLDPHACFLLQRGMKTMALRVQRHNENAMALATHLAKHTKVKKVYYPGLETSPSHSFAKKWFRGFGGMLSFELNATKEQVCTFLKALHLFAPAPSLGGVESLIICPAQTSHIAMCADQKTRMGVCDTLIRISVGIEDIEDLIQDIEQAMEKIA